MNRGLLSALAPTVNFAARSIEPARTDFGVRIIPDCQIFYVIQGKAELRYGAHHYVLLSGDAVYYSGDMPHHLRLLEETSFYSLHFHWDSPSPEPTHPAHRIRNLPDHPFGEPVVADTIELVASNSFAIPTCFKATYLEPVFERIVKEYMQEKIGYPFMLRALMMELLTLWLRQLQLSDQTFKSRLDPAFQAISDHPERIWTIASLAALCGYHPTYFAKLFRDETGVTPKAYLMQEKLRKAKRYLLENRKLEEIADLLQYGSLHYFSHHFKRVTGLTPTEFRQQGKRPGES